MFSPCGSCFALLLTLAATLALPSNPTRSAVHFQVVSSTTPQPASSHPIPLQVQMGSKRQPLGGASPSTRGAPPLFPAYRNSPDYQVKPNRTNRTVSNVLPPLPPPPPPSLFLPKVQMAFGSPPQPGAPPHSPSSPYSTPKSLPPLPKSLSLHHPLTLSHPVNLTIDTGSYSLLLGSAALPELTNASTYQPSLSSSSRMQPDSWQCGGSQQALVRPSLSPASLLAPQSPLLLLLRTPPSARLLSP
jgi:hypothetical protein